MNRSQIIVAIVVVAVATIVGAALNHDDALIIVGFGGNLCAVLATNLKVEQVHHEMNSMKDALVIAAGEKGVLQGRAEGKKDERRNLGKSPDHDPM